MELKWIKPSQLTDVAAFIASMNREAVHNIGFCGENEAGLLKALNEDFIDGEQTSIVAVFEDGEIQSLIGLDLDETTAEVWGPFTKTEDTQVQVTLLQMLQQRYPSINSFYFFINEQNKQQLHFLEQVNAKKDGEHLLLEVERATFEAVDDYKSSVAEPADFDQFMALHNEAFPNAYYDAETIYTRLSDEHILRVLKIDEIVVGYAYFEMDLATNHAHLEFIAIAPNSQGKGFGTLLLREVLTEMFRFDGINGITLAVNNKKEAANHVYYKAGFKKKATLWSFIYEP